MYSALKMSAIQFFAQDTVAFLISKLFDLIGPPREVLLQKFETSNCSCKIVTFKFFYHC